MLSPADIILVITVGIIVVKVKKIPELGRSLGKTLGEFKKGLKGEEDPRPSRDVLEATKDGGSPKPPAS